MEQMVLPDCRPARTVAGSAICVETTEPAFPVHLHARVRHARTGEAMEFEASHQAVIHPD